MVANKNQHILEFFKKAIETKKLAHGYLFWGPDPFASRRVNEMKDMALWLAEYLKTDPFDVLYIVPEEDKKEISINQIRNARRHLSLSPYNSQYKFAIIDRAETMNLEAANALLKTLEEPTRNTILILITSKPDFLPKTINSRLEEIRFKGDSVNEIAKEFLKTRYIDILKKSLNEIFKEIEEISKDDSETSILLDSWLFLFREKLIKAKSRPEVGSPENFIKILKEIQKTKDLISTTNVNQRLALENLVLCIRD